METNTTENAGIVVGVDGSPSSDLAVDWAAAEAAAEQLPLLLLAAGLAPADSLEFLRRAESRARAAQPGIEVSHHVSDEDPRDALIEARAGLLVVGTRGLGTARRLLLGSVASTVVKQATGPTVVVRPTAAGRTLGVVVGVAGDSGDAATVDLAFRIAAVRRLPVTAFHSWWDVVGVDESRDLDIDEPGYETERSLVLEAVAAARARHPDVEVSYRLTRGFADERLIRASREADLVVVGHRRKPFLNELVYGSLAPRVVEHARCPVAVVPFAISRP